MMKITLPSASTRRFFESASAVAAEPSSPHSPGDLAQPLLDHPHGPRDRAGPSSRPNSGSRKLRLQRQLGAMGFSNVSACRNLSETAIAEIETALAEFQAPTQSSEQHWDQLCSACLSGHRDAFNSVLTLMRHGILKPETTGRLGDTLLHALARQPQLVAPGDSSEAVDNAISRFERISRLHASGISFTKSNDAGMSPLIVAAQHGNTEMVKDLVDAGADVNHAGSGNQTAALVATRHGHPETLKALIDLGADLKVKRLWLPGSANISTIAACGINDGKMVRTLTAAGVPVPNPEMFGRTQLLNACLAGDAEKVAAMIAAGADPNERRFGGVSLLQDAGYDGHVDVIDKLIAGGARINARCDWHWTPLIAASYRGQIEVVEKLIAAGADLNVRDLDGNTAAMIAGQNGRVEIVNKLIAAGADPSHRDRYGRNALSILSDNLKKGSA